MYKYLFVYVPVINFVYYLVYHSCIELFNVWIYFLNKADGLDSIFSILNALYSVYYINF